MCTWSDPLRYKLFPLCRAIILVLDEVTPHTGLDPDGFISLDNELQIQSVLIVRPGNESGLSEPINLETVREQAIPLARSDVTSHDAIDVMRVALATAVQCIINLRRREGKVIPDSALDLAVDTSLPVH